LQKAFHLPEAMPNLHSGFKALFAALNDAKVPPEKRGFELAVANALWGASTYPWKKEYIATVTGNYGAGLFDTDFAKPEVARKRINSWVEEQTRDKIKDLLPMGSVTDMTRLVLTNAIYFKGKWELEFDKKLTKDAPFTMAGGKKTDVPMMHKSAGFMYGESETMKALELPYIGKETSMLVMLPKKAGTLSAIEQKITSKEIDGLIQGLRYEKTVILSLPKFKIETDYELSAPLKQLGVTDVFSAKADLTGMHTGGEHLSVTAAVHKAFVEVDEKGTEAAAATGIVVGTTSVQIPKPPKEFKADHPFLFAIRHKPTNTILFFGKVEKF